MINANYRCLIQELCDEAGIGNWEQVADCRHVDVEGVTTGLHHNEAAPDTLSIYFDFGIVHDTEVLRRLPNTTPPRFRVGGPWLLRVDTRAIFGGI